MAHRSFYVTGEGGVTLYLRAAPGAKRDEIAGVWRGADGDARLAVKVSAPPDKGKANAAIIKMLSNVLGVPKSAIAIASGETSRLKTVEIEGNTRQLEQMLRALWGP